MLARIEERAAFGETATGRLLADKFATEPFGWDFEGVHEFYNPGRAIGGRACPRTVLLDRETLGTVFYDVDAKQPDGPGVFFLRTPLAKLQGGK